MVERVPLDFSRLTLNLKNKPFGTDPLGYKIPQKGPVKVLKVKWPDSNGSKDSKRAQEALQKATLNSAYKVPSQLWDSLEAYRSEILATIGDFKQFL